MWRFFPILRGKSFFVYRIRRMAFWSPFHVLDAHFILLVLTSLLTSRFISGTACLSYVLQSTVLSEFITMPEGMSQVKTLAVRSRCIFASSMASW